jgi:Fucose permease
MIAFVTGLQNPMGVIIKSQFTLSNLQSQFGNFANFIAYAFMGIPAGLLLQKMGYKKTALSAIAVGFIGVAVTFLSSRIGGGAESKNLIFSIYLVGAFISGFSMCMLNTVVNPMLNTLGGGGNKGNQLIQFGGACNSIGATIVPVLVGYLMGDISKASLGSAAPALYIAMGIFALAFIVLFTMNIPEPYVAKKETTIKEDLAGPLSYRHFIFGAIAIFIYVGVEVGIPNIANLFMTNAVELGGLEIDTTIAGTVVGTYWFLMLIGRLVGGALGSKFSSRSMLTFVASIAIIFILLGIFSPLDTKVQMPVFKSDISFGFAEVPISIMFFVLCGLCTSVMWGGIFNLAVEGLGKYTAAASGIFMTMVCGGGILPAIQGLVADKTSYLTSYWVIFAGILYMLFFALIGSRITKKEKAQ